METSPPPTSPWGLVRCSVTLVMAEYQSYYPQWVFYFLVWGGILLLYSGSSTAQAKSGEASQRPQSRGDFDLGQDGFIRALDDLFSPSTIAKQNVINILGVRYNFRTSNLWVT